MVVECLAPCDQGKTSKSLGLKLESKVEVLDNRVDTERYAACVDGWSAQSTKNIVPSEKFVHIDQSMSMVPGRPSVLFRRQLVHICGMICIHQQLQSQPPLANSSCFGQGLDVGVTYTLLKLA